MLPLVPGLAPAPLVVDGHLDEPAWAQAATTTDFAELVPEPGAADPGRTEVRFLQDDRFLYVGVSVQANPAELNAPLVARDQSLFHDWVGVVLDTFADGQRGFSFRVSPSGVQADGIYTEGGDIWMQDLSWDTVWSSAARVGDEGWTAEVAIPWRSLRYPRDTAWKVVVLRFRPSPWTLYAWPRISVDAASVLGQGAELAPTPPPSRALSFEAIPTLTSALDFFPPPSPNDGLGTFRVGESVTVEPGVSARVGLSSSMSADLALNPDFSQIEADADQVTANRKYPLEFKEKRPFFLESADLFDTPLRVAYSRSVADPLVGYKLSGRADRLGVGFLGAYDEAPTPSTVSVDYATGEALPGWSDDVVVGATAVDHLARLRLDTGHGGSIGFVATDKELLGVNLGDASGRLGNHVAGFDAVVPVGEQWQVEAQALYSLTDQRSGPALHDPAWALAVAREGDDFTWTLEHEATGRGFRAENGFLEEVGRVGVESKLQGHLRGLSWSRSFDPDVHAGVLTDLEGTPVGVEAGPGWASFVLDRGYTEGEVNYVRERVFGQDFNRWNTEGFFAYTPAPTANLWTGWSVGPQPHYDPNDLFLGFGWAVSAGVSGSAFGRLTVDNEAHYYQFHEPSGAVRYDGIVDRLVLTYNLSRPVSVRVVEDVDTFDDTLDSSLLLGWVENYGTAAWLGYGETYSFDDGWTARTVFAKLSYLWRL